MFCLMNIYYMIEPLIDDVLAAHRPLILKNKLNIKVKVEPLSISADRERLTIIIDNLLSNALKYSQAGGKVSLCLEEKDNRMVLDITDYGPGIPEVERDAIFQPFVQGSTACRSAIKGSGLGLAIAREYAMAHGGDILLIAAGGGDDGTCFRLIMPTEA